MNSTGKPVRIVLVDDEHLLRCALAALLPLNGTVEVAAEADNGTDAIAAVSAHRPDVLVIDFEMPGMDGLDTVAVIREKHPEQRVLMLTRHARPGVLRRALKLGVAGFIGKSSDPDEIMDVIHQVHDGHRWIAHEVLTASMTDDCPLTDREADALRETRSGYSVKHIAVRLHLAPGTVRNYLSATLAKTGTTTRHDAARVAEDRGWL